MSLLSDERSVEDGTMQTTRDLFTITVSSHFGSETFPCFLIRTDKETSVFYINNHRRTCTLALLRLSYSLLLWCNAPVLSLRAGHVPGLVPWQPRASNGASVSDIYSTTSWSSLHTFVWFYHLDATLTLVAHSVLPVGPVIY